MRDYELFVDVNGGEFTMRVAFKADKVEEIGGIYNEVTRVMEYHLVIDGKLFIFDEDYILFG